MPAGAAPPGVAMILGGSAPAKTTVQMRGWTLDSGGSATQSTADSLSPSGAMNPLPIYSESIPVSDLAPDPISENPGALRVAESGTRALRSSGT